MNGEREGREGTHVEGLDASELGELPCLADGEGAVGVELGLVYEAGVVGRAWGELVSKNGMEEGSTDGRG